MAEEKVMAMPLWVLDALNKVLPGNPGGVVARDDLERRITELLALEKRCERAEAALMERAKAVVVVEMPISDEVLRQLDPGKVISLVELRNQGLALRRVVEAAAPVARVPNADAMRFTCADGTTVDVATDALKAAMLVIVKEAQHVAEERDDAPVKIFPYGKVGDRYVADVVVPSPFCVHDVRRDAASCGGCEILAEQDDKPAIPTDLGFMRKWRDAWARAPNADALMDAALTMATAPDRPHAALEAIGEDIAQTPRPTDTLLHRLWTKAVGTPGYNKAQWRALESVLASHQDNKTTKANESGPGIAQLPEPRPEPLAFLDTDLLCEDE